MSVFTAIMWLLLTITGAAKVSNDAFWLIWAIIALSMAIELDFSNHEEEENEDEDK